MRTGNRTPASTCDLSRHQCGVLGRQPSEAVKAWLKRFDMELALPVIVIAEMAYGYRKAFPTSDQTSRDLMRGVKGSPDGSMASPKTWRWPMGDIMGLSVRLGRQMSTQDGLIAAISHCNGGRLATRNVTDFEHAGLQLINPWDL